MTTLSYPSRGQLDRNFLCLKIFTCISHVADGQEGGIYERYECTRTR
jgi:hypothetical protein